MIDTNGDTNNLFLSNLEISKPLPISAACPSVYSNPASNQCHEGGQMPEDVAGAVLDKVKQFTIGFGGAGDDPAAKGSGVQIKHTELHGILTCAHVDQYLRTLKHPVGLVRLNRGLAQQFGTCRRTSLETLQRISFS
jgi:hypothetical protein